MNLPSRRHAALRLKRAFHTLVDPTPLAKTYNNQMVSPQCQAWADSEEAMVQLYLHLTILQKLAQSRPDLHLATSKVVGSYSALLGYLADYIEAMAKC